MDPHRPRLFDYRDYTPTGLKIWLPLVLWSGAVLGFSSSSTGPVGYIVFALLAVAGLFLATLALILPSDKSLKLTRLTRWRPLDYGEIVSCGESFIRGIGFLRLKRPVPPWGRIYFVFYAPVDSPVNWRGKRQAIDALVHYVNERVRERRTRPSAAGDARRSPIAPSERGAIVRHCVIAGIAGSLWTAIIRGYLFARPAVLASPSGGPVFAEWGAAYGRIGERLLDWPTNIIPLAGLLAMTMWLIHRRRRDAWIAALCLGGFIGGIVVRMFDH